MSPTAIAAADIPAIDAMRADIGRRRQAVSDGMAGKERSGSALKRAVGQMED